MTVPKMAALHVNRLVEIFPKTHHVTSASASSWSNQALKTGLGCVASYATYGTFATTTAQLQRLAPANVTENVRDAGPPAPAEAVWAGRKGCDIMEVRSPSASLKIGPATAGRDAGGLR